MGVNQPRLLRGPWGWGWGLAGGCSVPSAADCVGSAPVLVYCDSDGRAVRGGAERPACSPASGSSRRFWWEQKQP